MEIEGRMTVDAAAVVIFFEAEADRRGATEDEDACGAWLRSEAQSGRTVFFFLDDS